MKRGFVLGILLAAVFPAAAQTEETVRAALYLTGADSAEQLDETLLEELEGYRHRPLPVNRASRARMLESGLLSGYQVASLEDYRSVSGDILSFAELELVDGFGKEAVAVLRPFLSLESARVPGEAVHDSLRFKHSVVFRATMKDVGAKYRLAAGRLEGAGAWRGNTGTFYGRWNTRRGKVLLGDFNIRYGQGLAFWSAFQLSGLSTPEAFLKRGNGITPSWSFSGAGTWRGLAWDTSTGPFQFSVFAALDGRAGVHAGWLGRSGQASLTLARDRLSLEGRFGIRGTDLFAEGAWRGGSPSGLMGGITPLGECWKASWQVRALPSAYTGKKNGEYGAAVGGRFRSEDRTFTASLTLDGSLIPIPQKDPGRKQLKSTFLTSWTPSERWKLESRLVFRYRSGEDTRTDLRVDVARLWPSWAVKGRLNGLLDGHPGALTYLEGGWTPPAGALWLRLTLFSTPDWQARIYCYERDAPGNFTTPAYYGTGVSAFAYGGSKFRIRKTRIRLYLRASCLFRKEKPGQAGLKFQLVADR